MGKFDEAEKILKKYNSMILRICRKFSNDDDNNIEYKIDCEDLYQAFCLRFYEKWHIIRSKKIDNMQAFVANMCKNCCINYIRDSRLQMPKDMMSIYNYNVYRQLENTGDQ